MTKAITLWGKVFPLGLPFTWSVRSYPKRWHCWHCHLHGAPCKRLSKRVRGTFVDVLLLITIKDLKNWLPQIENIKVGLWWGLFFGFFFISAFRESEKQVVSCQSNPARLPLPEVVNFSTKNEHAREEERTELSVIPLQRFSQLLCRLSAGDGCTDGMRFLHMLSVRLSSSLRRRQCKQTWVWASHPALLGRWGRHVYKHQWEWGKRKNSLEVVNFDPCPDIKQFQSGEFGFKMLFLFIPPKRRHPRKGDNVEKIKAPVRVCQQSIPAAAKVELQPRWKQCLNSHGLQWGGVIHLPAVSTHLPQQNTWFLLGSRSIHPCVQRADIWTLHIHTIPWPHSLITHLPWILSPDSSPRFTSMRTAQVMQCKSRSSAHTV